MLSESVWIKRINFTKKTCPKRNLQHKFVVSKSSVVAWEFCGKQMACVCKFLLQSLIDSDTPRYAEKKKFYHHKSHISLIFFVGN